MKKIIKLIIINFLIIFLFLFIFDVIAYLLFKNEAGNPYKDAPFSIVRYQFDYNKWKNEWYGEGTPFHFRPYTGTEYKKGGIVLFGCSYMYGSPHPFEKTLAYKISHETKRPVYNLAVPGSSTQHALMQIESHDYDDIIKSSDYAIYMPIGEHLWRIKTFSSGYTLNFVWPRYVEKNGKLVFYRPLFPMIESSYLFKYLYRKYWISLFNKNSEKTSEKMFNLMKLHLQTINEELHKINPNIKFVVLLYPDSEKEYDLNYNQYKRLEKDGIIVLDVRKMVPQDINIASAEYRVEDDGHPTIEAWDMIRPQIVSQLGL